MNHPRLQELFSLGVIDFAVLDAEADKGAIGGVQRQNQHQPQRGDDDGTGAADGGGGLGVELWGSGCLRLELSGEEIRPGDLENPVIVVANYVFDSLKQDAFRCDCYISI